MNLKRIGLEGIFRDVSRANADNLGSPPGCLPRAGFFMRPHGGSGGLPVREARALPVQDFGFAPGRPGFDVGRLWEAESFVRNPAVNCLVRYIAEVPADLRLGQKPVGIGGAFKANRWCGSYSR
jgi:hypothetical protein